MHKACPIIKTLEVEVTVAREPSKQLGKKGVAAQMQIEGVRASRGPRPRLALAVTRNDFVRLS